MAKNMLYYVKRKVVHMNNLKNIREIYGITQEEIAKAINVNRATISNWENQEDKKASSASLEKLSLFYGIGPEFFYDEALNDTVREMLVQNSKHQREIEKLATENMPKPKTSITYFLLLLLIKPFKNT